MTPRRWFLVILAGAIVLRTVMMAGAIFQDDAHYIDWAYRLSQGQPPTDNIFGSRIGLVGPTALLYRFVGVNAFTTCAFPFLCSVGSVVAAFGFGTRLLGARAGVTAALLAAVLPLDVIYSGVLFGTSPVLFFAGVAVGTFLVAEESDSVRLYVLAGAALGLGALVHETALIALIYYPFHALLIRSPRRRQLGFLVGLVAALLLDPAIHGLLGNPWARLDALAHARIMEGTSPDAFARGLHVPWLTEPFTRMFTEQELGLFPYFLVFIAPLRLFRPTDRSTRALALFVVVVALWIFYGTMSPLRFAPLSRQPRYLAPVALPAVWLLAGELARPRLWARLALAALVASSLFCAAVDGGRSVLVPYRRVRDVADALHPTRVVADRGIGELRFLEGFQPPFATVRYEPAMTFAPGDLVVVGDETARAAAAARSDLELVEHIPQPDTLYRRVLRVPLMMAVLEATRGHDRVVDLQRKRDAVAVDVFRVR